MNLEHVSAMKMKQMYEHYVVRRQQRLVQQLSDKVREFIQINKTTSSSCIFAD